MDNDTTTEKNPEGASGAQVPATMQDLAATMGGAAPDKSEATGRDDADEQRRRVNDGRLKKTSEELAAANARIAELEARLAKADEASPAFDADAIKKFAKDPDDVDDAFAATTAGAMNALRDRLRKEVKGEFDAMRAEFNANREAAAAASARTNLERTLKEVEGAAPGLVVRIARGDLKDKWNSFLEGADPFSGASLRGILQDAVRNGRVEAAKEVYARFVRETGLSGQYGGATLAPPRGAAPVATRAPGGGMVYPGRDAIFAEMDKLTAMKRRGTIDQKTYVAKSDELENALREGRYVK